MDKLVKMKQLIDDCQEDFEKGKGGNKAAGTRVRKTMQDIKALAQEIRADMLESRTS